MDIQTELQKIHHQFGVTEKANYEIQKLFDKAIKEAVTEALRIHDVVERSEQLLAVAEYVYNHFDDSSSKTAKDYLQDFLSQ